MTTGKAGLPEGVEEQSPPPEQGWVGEDEEGKEGTEGTASPFEAFWKVDPPHPCHGRGQRSSPHAKGEGSGQTMAARNAHHHHARTARRAHHLRGHCGDVTTEATTAARGMGSWGMVLSHVTGRHGHARL